jgi:hypothetical protein
MIWQLQASQSISQCLTLGTFAWFRLRCTARQLIGIRQIILVVMH